MGERYDAEVMAAREVEAVLAEFDERPAAKDPVRACRVAESNIAAKGRGWLQIELEAREEALALVRADEATPLPWGHPVAWAESKWGHTEGFSVVHRAENDEKALCGEAIPPAIVRVPLTFALIGALGRCKWCEMSYAKRENAA